MDIGNRVVVTGIGITANKIISKNDLWDCISQSIIEPDIYESIIDYGFSSKKSFWIDEKKDLNDYIQNSDLKRKAKFSKMLCVSGNRALEDAQITNDSEYFCRDRIGTIVTTVHGPMEVTFKYMDDVIKNGPRFASPNYFQQTVNNVACGQLCIQNNLKGVSSTLIGCSSISYAYKLLKKGMADAILTSAVEELHPHIYACHSKLGLLARDEGRGELSVPMSDAANGIVLGETSVSLVLETYESAIRRNAHIYAEIIDTASVTDEVFCKHFSDFADEDSTGIYRAMKKLLDKYNYEIDLISLCANSHKSVDYSESRAIEKLFDEKRKDIGYVASKAIFGETLGSSEMAAVVCALMCIDKSYVPGLRYSENDTFKATKSEINYALVNSFFLGGSVNSLLLGKVR